MDVSDAISLQVVDDSQVSQARRLIVKLAKDIGVNQSEMDKIALVITELATNLIKHSKSGGDIIAQGCRDSENIGLDVLCVDKGPGMDIGICIEDGYSTSGTMGTGLGAAKRMSSHFDIYSKPGTGTIINVRFWNNPVGKDDTLIGGLSVPITGELISGDKWQVERRDQTINCLLVDGLGHGFEACEAAIMAVKRFKENLHLPPSAILKVMHTALRGSRGAVGAVAKIDLDRGLLHYSGLGNITGLVYNDSERKHLVSLNGTLGYENPKTLDVTVPWITGSVLVMHSDGISTRAGLDNQIILEQSAEIIAAWLYLYHSKKLDDSTILVVKDK
ncbi:MAG: SpoIIE family protein phosphatase [Candidatus Obscuribacter sp.]|nr:SpoIIE family protein phosphatase [Candidatus Obscuribacter sp.]